MIRKQLIGNPENLTNKDIQQIGRLHAKKNGDDVAAQMASYDVDNSPQEKWIFLANSCGSLNDRDDLLVVGIKNLFNLSFNNEDSTIARNEKFHISTFSSIMERNVNDYFKKTKSAKDHLTQGEGTIKMVKAPRELTNDVINDIGSSYLKHYGNKPSFLSGLFQIHTNHHLAKKLQTCKVRTYKDRWLFLADIYSELPNNRGDIAKQIRQMFIDAFTPDAAMLENVSFMDETFDLALEMKTLITNHFQENPMQSIDIHPIDSVNQLVEYGKKSVGDFLVNAAMTSVRYG